MATGLKIPPFGTHRGALNAAGVKTKTGRGFWGGVAANGTIVVTSWTDTSDGQGRFRIWRPPTNHGGLKTEWEIGNIREKTKVRLIMLRNRAPNGKRRTVGGAALIPGKWQVVKMLNGGSKGDALIERI